MGVFKIKLTGDVIVFLIKGAACDKNLDHVGKSSRTNR
jgi:hypothetical protein